MRETLSHTKKLFDRSLFSTKTLSKGHVISSDDLISKTGFFVLSENKSSFVGKILIKDIVGQPKLGAHMSIFRTLTIIVDRANYGRLFPLIEALKSDSRFSNKVCLTGTTMLSRNRVFLNLSLQMITLHLISISQLKMIITIMHQCLKPSLPR